MLPQTCYLICTTPRSGSELLCEALTRTGLAGQPGEYFFKDFIPGYMQRFGASDLAGYLPRLFAATTSANGVFGAKVMGGAYLNDFIRLLRREQGRDLPAPALLAGVFPNLRYIWLTRRNKVRQAVSHWRAIQSGLWHAREGEPRPPEQEAGFLYEAVDALVQDLVLREVAWQEYFAAAGVSPLTVVYEDFVPAPEETVRSVMQFLGIPMPEGWRLGPLTEKRLADAKSELWVQQYLERKQAGDEYKALPGLGWYRDPS